MTEHLHEQPPRVAARAASGRERFLGRLHARLEADQVADLLRELPVQIEKELHRPARTPIDPLQEGTEPRARRCRIEKRREIFREPRLVDEWKGLSRRLQKKVERVDDRQLDDEIDIDRQLTSLL